MLAKLDREFLAYAGTGHIAGDPGAPWHGKRNWAEASWSAAGNEWFFKELNEWSISQHSGFKGSTLVHRIKFSWMQIFLDLAVLVEAQGEMLDNIETQVWWLMLCHSVVIFLDSCNHILLNIKIREPSTELLALYLLKDLVCSDLWYIYTQVTGAADHIQTGTNLLGKAKKLQKNTRKWTCYGIILLLIIILVVILSLKPWNW